jgi:hypothetical protein
MVFLRGFGKDQAWPLVRGRSGCIPLKWPKTQSLPHKYGLIKKFHSIIELFESSAFDIVTRVDYSQSFFLT